MNWTRVNAQLEYIGQLTTRGLFWHAVLSCYLSVLCFLSLNPWFRPVSTTSAFSPDKLDHGFAYGGLAVIVYLCARASRDVGGPCRLWTWPAAVGAATLVGILLEIAQSLFTTNRTGSVEDAVANALGAVLGFFAFQVVKYGYAKSIGRNKRCPP